MVVERGVCEGVGKQEGGCLCGPAAFICGRSDLMETAVTTQLGTDMEDLSEYHSVSAEPKVRPHLPNKGIT